MVNQWQRDGHFLKLVNESKKAGTIITGESKTYMIYQLARQARNLPGDVAEFGVFRGATARILARAIDDTKKKVHLFDTFEGMPPVDRSIDVRVSAGQFKSDINEVKAFLSDCDNIVFHKGFFPDTTKGLENQKYSFVHIDADIYSSTVDGLEYFYPRMSKGGMILFDDYHWPHTPGVAKAVQEFTQNKGERIIVLSLEYQALIIKL